MDTPCANGPHPFATGAGVLAETSRSLPHTARGGRPNRPNLPQGHPRVPTGTLAAIV